LCKGERCERRDVEREADDDRQNNAKRRHGPSFPSDVAGPQQLHEPRGRARRQY
jgi:hypothetical protein